MKIWKYLVSFTSSFIFFLIFVAIGFIILLIPASSSSLNHTEFCELLEPQLPLESCKNLNQTNALKEAFPLNVTNKGTVIVIDHSANLQTVYYHTDPTVAVGDAIQQGDTIGNSANTGWSTGAHLHYSLRFTYGGRTTYLDPAILPSIGE